MRHFLDLVVVPFAAGATWIVWAVMVLMGRFRWAREARARGHGPGFVAFFAIGLFGGASFIGAGIGELVLDSDTAFKVRLVAAAMVLAALVAMIAVIQRVLR